jgi:putative transposase
LFIDVVDIPEATYHYHVKKWERRPGHGTKKLITHLFKKVHERYGYKRITKELKKLGHCVNHKKVYRLMREQGLKCVNFMRKSRKYNSYKGNVGKVSKNRLARRFSTLIPLQKLVSYEMLKRRIEDYIYWYNNERSKEKLTGLSPVEYRIQSSQSAA